MEISAVILTNGEVNLDSLKKSLYFCSEVLVLTDPNITDFARARNEGLKKAKNDWVLFIDSDEVVPQALASEIVLVTENPGDFDGYYIKRKIYFLGSSIGEDSVLRLGRKNSGKWERAVHETWNISGKTGHLQNYINHYTAENLHEYIEKINKYAEIHANENLKEGKRSSILQIIVLAKLKFLQNILFGRGMVFSLLQSFHTFLSWSQLQMIQSKSNKR